MASGEVVLNTENNCSA